MTLRSLVYLVLIQAVSDNAENIETIYAFRFQTTARGVDPVRSTMKKFCLFSICRLNNKSDKTILEIEKGNTNRQFEKKGIQGNQEND